ncbi:integrating conjugative element protein [Escherichia coli]|uniref:integrating conjugative element protein n=1 Tax=Escherichia coli TaxID=562 RepID=UPI000B3DBA85|nr:integrating conjugative element protein [Escherichia coli]EEY4088471.1 integrating conjugative element protein [Escherichia coli]EFC1937790.1 integrating conjugative element protein [Escherichia coli]EFH8799406.1 integrating conjugative element protein [Escherichia coli]EFN2275529.1 integrating conjugative element protein [Escherichia coli]EFN5185121.1 integrating conjugative element protein [Escherichia coli]
MMRFPLVLALLFPGISQAELTVVADLGGQSTAEYFAGINNQEEALSTSQVLTLSTPDKASVLPIRTPELSPGPLEARSLSMPGMRSIFLIGDDDLSRHWLALRRDRLVQLNAVGYVVNIVSKASWDDLQHQANGLELLPVSGSDLAVRLGISHYPVLISEKGLEQ